MYQTLKSLLFRLDAEKAHTITTKLFKLLCKTPVFRSIISKTFLFEDDRLKQELWGLTFKNPVGLAAGFDKNGMYIESMAKLGFGFIELGTVTPRPQIGNPKPRLFRLKKDRAILNRMGFNNQGVDFLVDQLKKSRKHKIIIGGNIGKNKDTPNEKAHEDYLVCFQKLYPYVDYFVVNLSSPNTPGLRELQDKKPLTKILSVLLDERANQTQSKPILLKIAPDLSQEQLDDVIDIVQELNIEGVIATNTTIKRDNLQTSEQEVNELGAGGLSGGPLMDYSTSILSYLNKKADGKIPIIGVGGISSGESAEEKLNSGAKLIQVYSGLIYEGPFLIKKIKKHLLSKRA